MACNDRMPHEEEQERREILNKLYDKIAWLEAALCLNMKWGGDELFYEPRVKWEEAGIKKEDLMTWWENHQEKDRLKEREADLALQKEYIRKTALAKLTPEEIEILEIK
jgi:hypothetical protein